MNFTLCSNVAKWTNKTISYDDMINLVKENPKKDLINKLRTLNKEKDKVDYYSIKKSLYSLMPHGIFKGLNNNDLLSLSNYLYFDIDNFSNEEEYNKVYNDLINTNIICFISKSVGGKGISFLIKYNLIPLNIPDDTLTNNLIPLNILDDTLFNYVYNYVFDILVNKGFKLDNGAKGISRRWIISYDTNPYLSNNSINIDFDTLTDYSIRSIDGSNGLTKPTSNKHYTYEPDDTFRYEIIPYEDLRKQIRLCSELDEKIDGVYLVKEIDYYCINIYTKGFRKITDGNKHKEYSRLVNALCYLNPTISFIQLLSYLNFINENYTTQKMNYHRLVNYTTYLYKKIKDTGVYIKTRKKKIHFNKDLKLDKKTKMSMGAKINNKLRKNNKIEIIEELKDLCLEQGLPDTQKNVVNLAKELGYKGFSIATVKRLWNKEIDEKEILIQVNEKQISKETKFETIAEELFFKPFTSHIRTSTNEMIQTPIIDEKTSENKDMEFYELMKSYKPTRKIEEKEKEDFGDGIEIDDFIIDGSKL
jgi:hypothetical protein